MAQKGLEALVEQLPLPAAIVDWSLQPVFHNAAARNLCGDLRTAANGSPFKNSRADFQLPAPLLGVCREFKKECESTINTRPAMLRGKQATRHYSSPSLRASVTLLSAQYPSVAKPSFLLKLEKVSSSAELDLRNGFAQLDKLTRSQREIVELVREGKSNQEVANTLSRTVGTIKTELHAIFQKLGISSRGKLMALFQSAGKLPL